MMMSAHISFPNLRSPESVGEIRNGGAMSANGLVAEISRRFGAPQMANLTANLGRSSGGPHVLAHL